uniref:Secreted protein n=2 Tax=Brassica campestris TaxID=3711 RepID=M4DG14_BRACM
MLMKVSIFAMVQALVYLILSTSSSVFSKSNTMKRLHSFRSAKSMSISRILAVLQDMPAGGEMSPSSMRLSSLASPSSSPLES